MKISFIQRFLSGLALSLFFFSAAFAQQLAISGYVYDKANGESLIGATVSVPGQKTGAVTNVYGYYSISLPPGKYQVVFSYLGYETLTQDVSLSESANLNVRLSEGGNVIKEVVISAEGSRVKEHVQSTTMGKLSVPMEMLKKTPALFGESDIIKAVQLLPGVKRGGEGTTGMFVRGGGSDENLILLDEATVYNVGHALGFLSVFNSSSIKSVDMYKGAFPAEYGGRLSSIMDVRMREGNDKRFSGQGSIGNIATGLTFEGPILKEKCSFIVSGRRSYIDKLVKIIAGENLLPYYFYDLNAKVNYKLNDRDRLYLSSYFGRDVVSATSSSDSTDFNAGINSNLGNFTVTARWNHIYPSQKTFHNITLIRSQFRYKIEGAAFGNNLLIRSSIDDLGLKADFDHRPTEATTLKFGGIIQNHLFKPNLISTQGDISNYLKDKPAQRINSVESAVYGNADWQKSEQWRFSGGLRLSSLLVQSTFYGGAEPRLSARYLLTDRHSFKVGYAHMTQYLHLVSSSSLALPTDLWYPSTKKVKPSYSDQISAGYFTWVGKDKKKTELSVEAYYKTMSRLIEYREGARLILNDNYEDELIRGKGEAYGLEFLAQKNAGKLSGWIGYTLSWSKRTFDGLNQGKTYYARYDRRHDLSVVASWDITKRFGISGAFVFSSGNPFTPIVAKYLQPYPNYVGIDLLPVYSPKNDYRLNNAHRLDIDLILKGRKRKHWQGEWHFGAYNVYNRTQPNRVVITLGDDGREKYQEKGLFGVIGSISYNFKF